MELFSFWSWLALGTLLLILEVFGAGGYLLWIGMAAASVGVLTFLLPALPWEVQLLLFAVFSRQLRFGPASTSPLNIR